MTSVVELFPRTRKLSYDVQQQLREAEAKRVAPSDMELGLEELKRQTQTLEMLVEQGGESIKGTLQLFGKLLIRTHSRRVTGDATAKVRHAATAAHIGCARREHDPAHACGTELMQSYCGPAVTLLRHTMRHSMLELMQRMPSQVGVSRAECESYSILLRNWDNAAELGNLFLEEVR